MQQANPRAAPNKYIVFGKFKKMNTKVDRPALEENELAWLENLIPIGPNRLLTISNATNMLTINTQTFTSRTYGVTIGNVDYVIAFANDGSAYAINVATNAVNQFAAAGTFTNTPDLTTYASERILIIDHPVSGNGYATWDGTLFVKAGGVSPNIQVTNGGTYSSTPTVTITGGSGTGATAHALMGGSGSNQFVGQVVLDTAGTGYLPGDVLTVVFSSGAATATARVWPQVGGTSIGIFAGRVWWCSQPPPPNPQNNVRQLNFTGTQGYDDLSVANAAGATQITDADLAHNITCVRGLNNYLYLFGDNSIRQIGSLTVSNSITLFTPFTVSSDIGTFFPLTVVSYNRFVTFVNKGGVYALYGSSVQKISDDLDGIFQNVVFTNRTSAGIVDIHISSITGGSIHCLMVLVFYADPIQGITRPIFCIFDGKQWFLASTSVNVNTLCSLPNLTTQQWEAYAGKTSGGGGVNQDLTHLFQDFVTAIAIRFQTSLSPHGDVVHAKQIMHAGIAMTFPNPSPPTLNVTIDTENGSISYTWQPIQNFSLIDLDVDGYGKYIGATVTGTVSAASFNAICVEYADADVWGRSP